MELYYDRWDACYDSGVLGNDRIAYTTQQVFSMAEAWSVLGSAFNYEKRRPVYGRLTSLSGLRVSDKLCCFGLRHNVHPAKLVENR